MAITDGLLDRLVAAVGDHYLVEGELGRGGMAVVYRALDLRLNRPVAIKVLPPELAFNADVRTRFLREAQTAAQLAHPQIVPIYTVDEVDGIVFFVMALVRGESLAQRLAREPRRPVDEVRQVLGQVADALAYAHAHGVVHRDIKPDNIIIDAATGRAVVTDFGIARAAEGDHRLTVTGVAVGTPAYMSPEQALGEREVDGRSDLYSLGIVGYQMLAGETPFRAANTPAMLVKHVSEPPPSLAGRRPDAPTSLVATIERALAKRPEHRWPSAAAFREAIDHAAPYVPEPDAPPALRPASPVGPPLAPLAPFAAAPAIGPALPPPPGPGAGRHEWREWKRAQKMAWRAWAKDQGRDAHRMHAAQVKLHADQHDRWDERPLLDRVMAFRRSAVSLAVTAPIIVMINAATGGVPWSIFVVAFMAANVIRKASSLWADGIGPIDAFKKGIRTRLRAEQQSHALASGGGPALPAGPPADPAAALVPGEVLAGAHGEIVRRAAADRATARDVLSRLGRIEKEMIPDVQPTIDALVDRIAGLAVTLHRLDADVSGASLGQLDERVVALQKETANTDRDRRLALLQRQRASLHDLLDRRRALAEQLESASLALQNLKLDLLKLRSAGIDAALGDVTSATQEARALSRDIGHLLAATDDVRRL